METSIPFAYAEDSEGKVIVSKLSLTNLDDENPEDSKANIVCRTTVDDIYARQVEQYASEADFENFDGITYDSTMPPLDPIDAVFSASQDYEQYSTYDDGVDAYASCVV